MLHDYTRGGPEHYMGRDYPVVPDHALVRTPEGDLVDITGLNRPDEGMYGHEVMGLAECPVNDVRHLRWAGLDPIEVQAWAAYVLEHVEV